MNVIPKHTPAPWLLVDAETPFVYALNEQGTNQFDLSIRRGYEFQTKKERRRTSNEELMANANLIAASPRLAEILLQIVRVGETNETHAEAIELLSSLGFDCGDQ